MARSAEKDWLRIALVPLFVLACYLFDWHGWRAWNCTVYLKLSHALGVPSRRVADDTFLTLGHAYYFALRCTLLDGFCGSIPLLWERSKSILGNTAFLAAFFLVLWAANMGKLLLGMRLVAWGGPWWLCHEVAFGVFYFFLFLWIARRRGWLTNVGAPAVAVPAGLETAPLRSRG